MFMQVVNGRQNRRMRYNYNRLIFEKNVYLHENNDSRANESFDSSLSQHQLDKASKHTCREG